MKTKKDAIVVAVASAITAVPIAYAVMRGYDVLFKPQPNLAMVSSSTKIAMFWRIWIGMYIAPLVAIGAYEITRRDSSRGVRVLRALVVFAAVLITVQGLFLP